MFKYILTAIAVMFVTNAHAGNFHEFLGADNWGYKNNDYRYQVIDQRGDWIRLVLDSHKNTYHIELNDPEINWTTVAVMEEYLKDAGEYMAQEHNFAITVWMSSTGGLADAGVALNKLFKGWLVEGQKWSVSAKITKGQSCASACALAFMGAKFRKVYKNGKLQFHAPYKTSSLGVRRCDTNPFSEMNIKIKEAYSRLGNEKSNRLFTETNKCLIGNNLITYDKYDTWLYN